MARSIDGRQTPRKNFHRPKWVRKVGYAISDLRKDGLIKPAARNGVIITDDGRERLTLSIE